MISATAPLYNIPKMTKEAHVMGLFNIFKKKQPAQPQPQPEPKPEKLKRWPKEIKPKKGYYIDQQSIFSGFTADGYQFLKYIQVKILNQWRKE